MTDNHDPAPSHARSGDDRSAVQIVRISQLMADRREIHLEYKGRLYRLRITSNDKLILTK